MMHQSDVAWSRQLEVGQDFSLEMAVCNQLRFSFCIMYIITHTEMQENYLQQTPQKCAADLPCYQL